MLECRLDNTVELNTSPSGYLAEHFPKRQETFSHVDMNPGDAMLSSWQKAELLPALSEVLADRIRVTYLYTHSCLCPDSEPLVSGLRAASLMTQRRLHPDLHPEMFVLSKTKKLGLDNSDY